MNWTENQKKVIEARNKNLLVSAAAGSGKTAVLTERIISRITDPVSSVDVDHMLVVTFTKAAAAEMRERIANALYQKLQEHPENKRLRRQQMYLANAMITTIDSFCLQVVREHFYQADLDPGFRVADREEIQLLKSDVVKDLLESRYQEAEPDFIQFVESYVPNRNDTELEDMILHLFDFSRSYPWPSRWLNHCISQYTLETDTAWVQYLNRYLDALLKEIAEMAERAAEIANEADGPNHYLPMLEADRAFIRQLGDAGFDERAKLLSSLSFMKLAAKEVNEVKPEKKEQVKRLRDAVKKKLSVLAEKYYFQTESEMQKDLEISRKNVGLLVQLTEEFSLRFQATKQEAGIVDFGDLEHYALEILTEQDEAGNWRPTEIARAYSSQFDEVMIDEYQDSNLVQETILRSVSGEEEGRHHMFMVGDVKQSIYRFRMARPDLFLEKYLTYTETGTENQKIILDQNFRSRIQVLDMVNSLFYHCMVNTVGGIDYDAGQALYPGADYYTPSDTMQAELLLLETGETGNPETEEETPAEESYNNKQLEAHLAAKRIRELIDSGFQVYDKETGRTRSCRYGDMVILLRSPKTYADAFMEILMAQGIPVACESGSGYFDSVEVVTVMNLLTVIDNPYQDIPLAGVLLSPIGGFTNEELAMLSHENEAAPYLAEALMQSEMPKAEKFTARLSRYRDMVPFTPVYDLITYILADTGYEYYVAALPSGTQRTANLEQLKQRAAAYESTQYRGLFHFIRYVEKIRENALDDSEAAIAEQTGNAVRIMSIHGSKGLEFPIVFVSGLSKPFNQMDMRKALAAEPDLGLGIDYRNPETREKGDTLIRQAICTKMKMEMLGEELRILYVALTRAREKLILTATVKNAEKKLNQWKDQTNPGGRTISFQMLTEAQSFLDWIGCSYLKDPGASSLEMHVASGEELARGILEKQEERGIRKAVFAHWDAERVYDAETNAYLREYMAYHYPYADYQHIPVKYSVSDLKRASMQDPDAETIRYEKPESGKQPAFVQKKTPVSGAERGTAYHRIFELLDFKHAQTTEEIADWLLELTERKLLSGSEQLSVQPQDFSDFMNSELYARMRTAELAGNLYREQPFVIGIPANEVNDSYPAEEIILIQGIIDAYFEEQGELVLVDYKTDCVESAEQLRNQYGIQLEYYAKALTQLTGKPVKERILYSVQLQESIFC